jgi:2-polyprenyl-3-methyl-5-hydroxy-6-metoxy-1,4-benzoquinol methylase
MRIKETNNGYFRNIRKEMLEFIPANRKKYLDVGCGEGNFAALVKENYNAEVWGVEIAEEPAKKASVKLDKVIIGNIEEKLNELPSKYFDCISFNDVLEHFTNPFEILEKIKTKLNENGIVIASIPNVRYIGNLVELLLKKDWEYKSSGGILDFSHYRFFTERSIRRMFMNAGYEIIKIKGINSSTNVKIKIIEFITFGYYSDIKYLEYAVIAKIKNE